MQVQLGHAAERLYLNSVSFQTVAEDFRGIQPACYAFHWAAALPVIPSRWLVRIHHAQQLMRRSVMEFSHMGFVGCGHFNFPPPRLAPTKSAYCFDL